jgi:hypothetical protein
VSDGRGDVTAGREAWAARVTLAVVVAGSIALGFALTASGVSTWDTMAHFDRSRWLVHAYGLPVSPMTNVVPETMRWYGPLWMLFLGLASEVVLSFVHDPVWVQQALNFALYPTGLYLVGRLLRRAGASRATAFLAVALLFGAIRLGGHALVNVNDFPMAMLSLLVMLYLWVKLREVDATTRAPAGSGRIAISTLAGLGILATVPFLVRPPVAVQLLTLVAFLAFYGAATMAAVPRRARVALVLVPLVAALLFTVAVWPVLWAPGRRLSFEKGLTEFVRFNWVDDIRYFGRAAHSSALPRWYAFIWLPVMLSPPAFVLLLLGLGRLVVVSRRAPSTVTAPFALPWRGRTIDLSLARWLAIHAALLWLGVMVAHPTIYDEERHLLFLYPPLLVLAALGLDGLPARVKVGLGLVVVAASLGAYREWGRYSYVYKSPLIGDRSAHRFMGDYWGACVPLAVSALEGRVPPGATVLVPGPLDPALVQYDRLRAGPNARPGFGPYRILREPTSWPAYLILNNRSGRDAPSLRAIADGRSRELWQAVMPPGDPSDPACVLLEYPAPGVRAADIPKPLGTAQPSNGLGARPAPR